MERDYLVFWNDDVRNHADIVHIAYPPHDAPRGRSLEDMLTADIIGRNDGSVPVTLHGAVELAKAMWTSPGITHEIVVGDGAVRSLDCDGLTWRVFQ